MTLERNRAVSRAEVDSPTIGRGGVRGSATGTPLDLVLTAWAGRLVRVHVADAAVLALWGEATPATIDATAASLTAPGTDDQGTPLAVGTHLAVVPTSSTGAAIVLRMTSSGTALVRVELASAA